MRDWTAVCLRYIAQNYNVEAIDVDHGHYPPPVSIEGLFGYDQLDMPTAIKELESDLVPFYQILSIEIEVTRN